MTASLKEAPVTAERHRTRRQRTGMMFCLNRRE